MQWVLLFWTRVTTMSGRVPGPTATVLRPTVPPLLSSAEAEATGRA